MFAATLVFAVGVFVGASVVLCTVDPKAYWRGFQHGQRERDEQIRRLLANSVVAGQREAVLFDAWRSAKSIAVKMHDVAIGQRRVWRAVHGADLEDPDTREYKEWIATAIDLPDHLERTAQATRDKLSQEPPRRKVY